MGDRRVDRLIVGWIITLIVKGGSPSVLPIDADRLPIGCKSQFVVVRANCDCKSQL
jgi:hypothetical protein